MKVTYCASPVLAVREFNMANRILTSNLLKNDKLDVNFNYSAFDCYMKYDKQSFESAKLFDHPFRHSPQLWKETLRLHLSTYHYPEIFADKFYTDVILMSCLSNWYDYPFIAALLNKGHKLVLGGTNFKLWRSPEWVRNMMISLGVKEKYLDNFIIVYGVVDLTTDLHKIIKDWKNVKITENDFSTVWDCEIDYLENIKNTLCNVVGMDLKSESARKNFSNVTFLLNNLCWWGKCAFCGFVLQEKMDFDRGVKAERIAQNIINTARRLDANRIYFSNDYFSFNKKTKGILEILKNASEDYKISCYSGILACKDEEYLHNVNKYNLKYLKIGLEAGTDFALGMLNKGYGVAEVDDTVEKMSKILNKDVEITLHSIVDSPQRSRDEIRQNYNNFLRWRDTLRESGIHTNVVASSYAIIEEVNDDKCIDNVFIQPCEIDEAQSGRIKFLNELRNSFGDVVNLKSYDHVVPFNRIGFNGETLPTDFEVVPEETLDELYNKNWGWG